eukprot:TRINITY_DN70028_c0_g1_i1.p2 TRINITY_DN70028_c0_g1~~TRINITY_DN70028_c0_g1_i1.p2  ORF type:complete len:116 (-),score=4.93 TRINITY_DN70028_c0_g1_i1:32-349(-)
MESEEGQEGKASRKGHSPNMEKKGRNNNNRCDAAPTISRIGTPPLPLPYTLGLHRRWRSGWARRRPPPPPLALTQPPPRQSEGRTGCIKKTPSSHCTCLKGVSHA